jgi:hypothetical protein
VAAAVRPASGLARCRARRRLFQVLGARSVAADGGVFRPMDLISYAILLVGPLALFWRRRYPVARGGGGVGGLDRVRHVRPAALDVRGSPGDRPLHDRPRGRRRDAILTAAGAYTAYLLITWVFAGYLGVPDGRTRRPPDRAAAGRGDGIDHRAGRSRQGPRASTWPR